MKKALIFISYHPGSLVDYDHIRISDSGKSYTVLVMCGHPYVTKEIIKLYSSRFDSFLLLPDVDYLRNIFKGFFRLLRFLKILDNGIKDMLNNCGSFDIISDCSAFLPVNATISWLRRQKKFNKLICIGEKHNFKVSIAMLKTVSMFIYTIFFRLFPVYCHSKVQYLYFKTPTDIFAKFKERFPVLASKEKDCDIPTHVHLILRPPLDISRGGKNTIIIFSDLQVKVYGCYLEDSDYALRLKLFFGKLREFYHGYKIICKPHPLDNGILMPGLGAITCELYKGGLTSEMLLENNASQINACYTVASTSVLRAAERGIPSYTLYKYLNFDNKILSHFFETDEARQSKFLYNIVDIGEIGKIDNHKCVIVEKMDY